eukprot:CAMPEP_0184862004 /NCGR_PEP_ID=MMETSP0580-20130426/6553_1 /TAXON_ID=1118495 /ORGANISM="Dactyliosolen fragilissimus" /LENGTH=318 /DNA_ID=CAMNT_0027359701 /DNA_START=33 /DNA_END=986 /DNA_ORIENTATION=+
MNDRLGEFDDDVPSWAIEPDQKNGHGDIEMQISGEEKEKMSLKTMDEFESENSTKVSPDGKTGDEKTNVAKDIMDTFFYNVESIKSDIHDVSAASKRITEMNEEMLMSMTDIADNEINSRMQDLISKTNKKAKTTKNLLAFLKEENTKLKIEETLKSSDMRVRENMCNTLTRKFIDEMKMYQNSQQKYKTDIKKKAERQIRTVKPDATSEEIDQIMKQEDGREALIKKSILEGSVAEPIKQAYTNVASKHQDVVRLEQSVAELHQMFLDFALLTEQQGELIDQIEYNVKAAADYVEDANVDVYHAIEYQKSIRKKQCW